MKRYGKLLVPGALAALLALCLYGCGGGAGDPRFRFIHDASSVGPVDVYVHPSPPGAPVDITLRTPAFANIVKGDTTPFREFKDGDYEVALAEAGTKTVILRRYWPFPSGKKVTGKLTVSGGVPNVEFRFD